MLPSHVPPATTGTHQCFCANYSQTPSSRQTPWHAWSSTLATKWWLPLGPMPRARLAWVCIPSNVSTPGSLDTPPPSQHWPPSLETTSLEQDLEGRHCFLDRTVFPKCQLSEWAGGEPALREMGSPPSWSPGSQNLRGSGRQRLHLRGLVSHGKLPLPRPAAWGGVP